MKLREITGSNILIILTMSEYNILLGKSKRRGARNEKNVLTTEINSTSKSVVYKDIKSVVDLYSIYRDEYRRCNRYRLTVTIKPYCTNVLYNTCTEVVKDEGSEKCLVATDENPAYPLNEGDVYGKTRNLYRNYMVSNTEYSSPDIGYEYLPGYDIFANHTLRNLSFRPILFSSIDEVEQNRDIFNTVTDHMRTKDGKTIMFFPRFSYETVLNNTQQKMHVYEDSNLLSFIDGSSANANLSVENGWYGFVNSSSLENTGSNKEHIFSHTINNVGNCGFVDMFPDRTRYSFVPKFNEYKKRYEKNWDIWLTYPWKNFYHHNLVSNVKSFEIDNPMDGDCQTNALAIMRVTRTLLSTNRETLLFRTYCKHGVSVNDKIAVYLSKDSGQSYERLPRTYTVDYVGDVNGDNAGYFFGVSSKTLLNDIFINEVETVFYTQASNNEPVDYIASNAITDVPTFVNNLVICVYYYTLSTGSDYDATYDAMPATVNAVSPIKIRVWDKTYTYMLWSNENNAYIPSSISETASYGDWNTFSDKPNQYVTDCIRVKRYEIYEKSSRKVKFNSNDITNINETINGFFQTASGDTGGWHLRFVRVVNDLDCRYYIRQFRKIPNFKFSEEALSDDIASNSQKFSDFIQRNATDENGTQLEFDSETYKLGFSKTLYGDDVAQVSFLDNIVVEGLKDNLGRPVSEIYTTIVKRNRGYKVWYGVGEDDGFGVEYSRCFGSVTTGFEYLDLDDRYDRAENVKKLKAYMSSVTSIYRDDEDSLNPSLSVEDWDDDREKNEITEFDNVFYGDVVEYSPAECKETVLSNACFRFNTAQREVGKVEDFNFTYTELIHDDFDPNDGTRDEPFEAITYKQWEQESGDVVDSHRIPIRRKEGYYYNPHTKIQLFKFGDKVYQGSHRNLRIKTCRPIQTDSIQIKVTTSTMHGVGSYTTVYLCGANLWYPVSVTDVFDNFNFSIAPIAKKDAERNGLPYIDWVEMCEGLLDGTFSLRVNNEKIPGYADRISDNLFMWREIVNPVDLPDNDKLKHPFANNSFYLEATANVYLRRQDPQGVSGVFEGYTGDIEGNVMTEKNNVYKSEEEIKCY